MQNESINHSVNPDNSVTVSLVLSHFLQLFRNKRSSRIFFSALLLCALPLFAQVGGNPNDLKVALTYNHIAATGDHVYLVTIPVARYTQVKVVDDGGQVEFLQLREAEYCVVDCEHKDEGGTAKVSTEDAGRGELNVELTDAEHCDYGTPPK